MSESFGARSCCPFASIAVGADKSRSVAPQNKRRLCASRLAGAKLPKIMHRRVAHGSAVLLWAFAQIRLTGSTASPLARSSAHACVLSMWRNYACADGAMCNQRLVFMLRRGQTRASGRHSPRTWLGYTLSSHQESKRARQMPPSVTYISKNIPFEYQSTKIS
jgi:hypothetical protein